MELSVVVLCYKAEENIIPFAKKLKLEVSKLTDSYEIVLVGNYHEGTSDKTAEIINGIAKNDPIFKVTAVVKKGMMGWDVRQGLGFSKGDLLCFIDGDEQFPIDSISECYDQMKTGKYGLVKTFRAKRKDGFQRAVISNTYNFIFKLMYPFVKSKDINSKPKMFTRDVYEQLDLSYDDWFIDAEIMIKISRLNIPFYEFPIEFAALKNRNSFVNFYTILEFVRNLISYKLKGK